MAALRCVSCCCCGGGGGDGVVVEFTSAMLLVYCIGVVPIQLSFWSNLTTCQRVPTMFFDMFVDLFFMA